MSNGCPVGNCSKSVIADCCAKAVSLDDNDGLRAPDEFRSKFGVLSRCDYYLVANDSSTLVLIEKTDLALSIMTLEDELSQKLKQAFKNDSEDYLRDESDEICQELVFKSICTEHREKALATLYILEYMCHRDDGPDLRNIRNCKRAAYVLLYSSKLKRGQKGIISKIKNALQHSLIKEGDFHCMEEKDFCKIWSEKTLYDSKDPHFDK